MLDYSSILGQYAAAITATEQGYANLYQDVVGGLQGVEGSALQKAQLAFQTGQGNILGSQVAHGLGNSTITGSMQTGLLGKYAESTGAIQADFGQRLAQAKLQAGLAGLGYRGAAAQAYAQLGGQLGIENARLDLQQRQIDAQLAIASLPRSGGGGYAGGRSGGIGGLGGYGPLAFGMGPTTLAGGGYIGGYQSSGVDAAYGGGGTLPGIAQATPTVQNYAPAYSGDTSYLDLSSGGYAPSSEGDWSGF